MQRTLGALVGLMLLAGCGSLKKAVGLKSTGSEYSTPSTTSIYGDWVLASAPDSTAFAGARQVRLSLQPGTFTITAEYPSQPAVVVSGSAVVADDGTLTLTPNAGTASGSRGALVMAAGQPLSLLASAAGNTLVFKPPTDRVMEPSSVWHKYDKAKQAGTVK